MADGLNKVFLMGGICADPEQRQTSTGKSVLNLRMAMDESYKDNSGQRQTKTEYINVVFWGARAEALGRILTKGSRVLVEGSITTSSYDDREGNKRYKTEVRGSNLTFAGGKPGNAPQGQRGGPNTNPVAAEETTDDDSDIPF